MSPLSTAPATRRSTVARWVSLLAVGYMAGGALLVRDYVVQSQGAPSAVSQSAAVSR
jgi:hypothetical protein